MRYFLIVLLFASAAIAEPIPFKFAEGEALTSGKLNTVVDSVNSIYVTHPVPKTHLIVNESGNLTIGETDLASTSTKLFVDGKCTFSGDVEFKGNVIGIPEQAARDVWACFIALCASALAIVNALYMRFKARSMQRDFDLRIAEFIIEYDERERWRAVR